MNRALVLAGAALIVAGAVMLAMLLSHANTPVSPVSAPVQSEAPSQLWPILIGLTLAGGAGLIGIGMNRWRQAR